MLCPGAVNSSANCTGVYRITLMACVDTPTETNHRIQTSLNVAGETGLPCILGEIRVILPQGNHSFLTCRRKMPGKGSFPQWL